MAVICWKTKELLVLRFNIGLPRSETQYESCRNDEAHPIVEWQVFVNT